MSQIWSNKYKAVAEVLFDLSTEDYSCGTFKYFLSGLSCFVL